MSGGRCQKLEDMSESQLKARRATRAKAVLERGEKLFEVEQVEVRSCNGGAKARGSFVYLGSLTYNKGSSGPEIRRRIKIQLGFSEDFAGMGNEGITFIAKRSSVLGFCSFCAFVR